MRIQAKNWAMYAGEVVSVRYKGRVVRGMITFSSTNQSGVTLAISVGGGGARDLACLDYDNIEWMEIDGPQHPRDRTT